MLDSRNQAESIGGIMDTLTLINFNRLLLSGDREAVALFIETHYTLDEDSRDLLTQWASEDLNKFPLLENL